MHMNEQVIRARDSRIRTVVVGFGEFILRRKRAAIALLVILPLLTTGDAEVFVLNAVGLAVGALLLCRLTGFRCRAKETRAMQKTKLRIARRTRWQR